MLRRPSARHLRRCGGFSLLEALVALSVTALAGAVLLLSVETTLSTTTDAVERTIADGVAQQVLDEILTKMWFDAEQGGDPLEELLGPTTDELLGAGTSLFNEIGDYHEYVAQPLKGVWGEPLGAGNDAGGLRLENFRVRDDLFRNWRQRTLVYYVDPHDHRVRLTSGTSPFRAIEVFIEKVDEDGGARVLSRRKRVVAYVPPPAT
jgi:type II secretory pathway pseudopilin PulG